ncbi:dolichol-p-glucose synthetase [Geofilum rubicundum JCM 15548]|uniref:Dolichol-p-glucose synthetase n=2 Tax=Geofilum TaxID=1236988 RepID=A0A0E9M071_9BACT|nr:dolichol-p-glucose synthetase [Geofilum rubicundum JCM 15548]
MPCLNEEETLTQCIGKAKKAIEAYNIDAEILIADNGSTDRSIEIATELGARVLHVKSKGYGSALSAGIEHAKGRYVIMGDSDDSYDFGDVPRFLDKLKEGNDLVMGNRFQGGIEPGAMPFLHKYLGNPVLSFTGRLFFNIPVNDFHCGLRAFDRDAVLNLGLSTSGMEFASEMVVKAALHNLKIAEIPTKLSQDGRSRPPHLNTWQDGWRHLRFLLLYSPKWLFLYPGLALVLFGLIITSILYATPVTINNVTFDIHTMLYFSMLTVVGSQIVLFYYLSKFYAAKSSLIPGGEIWIQQFNRWFSLEKGIGLGAFFLLAGVALAISSFLVWSKYAYGDLEPETVLRLVIPAVTFVLLGVQLVFNSFFISVLGLKTMQ